MINKSIKSYSISKIESDLNKINQQIVKSSEEKYAVLRLSKSIDKNIQHNIEKKKIIKLQIKNKIELVKLPHNKKLLRSLLQK